MVRGLGAYGEKVAAARLEAEGMRVLERNWRCSRGEIDIVAVDGDCLVICEVKARRSTAYGTAVEAVTPAKIRRLRQLAALWLAGRVESWPQVRIDVVAVTRGLRGPASVEHLRGVG